MYVFIYDLLRWTFYNWERAWNNDKYMVPSWACKTQMIIILYTLLVWVFGVWVRQRAKKRDTITQRRLLMKNQLESMQRPVHSVKLTNKQVYSLCFTWSSKQEKYSCNASIHSCSSTRIVYLFRLTCTWFHALTWSRSSSWHSWVRTPWKDVTGIQECQMPTQLVPPRGQVILSNSRHYMNGSLSLLHPLQSRQGV